MSGLIAVCRGIERVNGAIGKAAAWLALFLVLVQFSLVLMRYVFGTGSLFMQESLIYAHAILFMMAAAWTLADDKHVRVDIFYRGMSPVGRARIDIAGLLLFLFPLCAFVIYESFDYVAASWAIREGARDAGGLPYPLISLLKSILLVMPLLVALQGLSLLLTSVRNLRECRLHAAKLEP